MPDNTFRLEGDTRDLERQIEALQGDFAKLVDETQDADAAQKKLDGTWKAGAKTAGTYAAAAKQAAEETAKLGDEAAGAIPPLDGLGESEEEAAEAARKLAEANAALSAIVTQTASDTVTASQKVIATYRERLAAIQALEGAPEAQAAAERSALERLSRDLAAIDEARFAEQTKLAKQASDIRRAAESDLLGPIDKVTQAYEDQIEALDDLAKQGVETGDARKAAEERLARELKKINQELEGQRLEDQRKSLDRNRESFNKAATAAGGFATALLAGAAAGRQLIEEVAGTVDEVNTLAAASGLSAETINGLRIAADATGKSITDLVPTNLPKKLADAANGSEEAARLFKQLGIQVTDTRGQLRSADEVLPEIIENLGKIEDPTTRAALASALLEEQGKQLLSAFGNQEDFQRFVDTAEMFAVDVGPEAAKQTSRWQQASAELSLAWENVLRLLQQSGAFEVAIKFVKDLALGSVFLTEVFRAFVVQSLERLDNLKDALLAFPSFDEVFETFVEGGALEASKLFDDFSQEVTDALGQGGVLGAFDAIEDAVGEATARTEAFFRLQTSGAEAAAAATDKGADSAIRWAGAAKKAEDATKRWITAQDQLIDIIDDLESDTLSSTQQINAAYADQVSAIEEIRTELEKLGADTFLVDDAIAASGKRRDRDLVASQKAANEAIRDIVRGAQSDLLFPIDEVNRAYEDRIALLDELERTGADTTAARLEAEARLARDIIQIDKDLADQRKATEDAFLELRAESFRSFLEMSEEAAFTTLESISELVTNLAEAEKERLEEQLEGTQDTIKGLRDERKELRTLLKDTENLTAEQEAQAEARLAQIEGELEATKLAAQGQRELINEQNAQVLAADKLARGAAIAQIAIDGARAFTAMVAFLAGVVGPAAPGVAGGIVAPLVAAQTAAVVSAPKPTLHDGGLLFGPTAPDERDVAGTRVLNGEVGVVLNQRAVDMGALEQVDALNRAADLGGGDRPLVLADAGRAFGEAWVRQAQTRGSAVNQVVGSPTGFANPHRRR